MGPAVLTFYREAWCPYCDIALPALQHHHAEIAARGARAWSPCLHRSPTSPRLSPRNTNSPSTC
ncbi:redoxin domain-containing protein [Streptomyces sp. NPDC019531]|uniref:redoxin domain-containing protein n=1 Tax=Streptomyces sp. NPDC019531 TaxID=3365062 RepID=UPI00384DDC1C